MLDQSPVPAGSTPGEALQNSIELARLVDGLGYTRFWMSEHHAMDTLACTAPEVMLARIGAETKRIRIGSGGIMLPHYTPLKVAECFRMLHALYPGRVDLGIGRAPGGGPVEALALKRERKTRMLDDFPEQVSELLAFLSHVGALVSGGASVCGDSGLAGYAGWAGCVDAGFQYVERRRSSRVWAALLVRALFFARCIRGRRLRLIGAGFLRANIGASGGHSGGGCDLRGDRGGGGVSGFECAAAAAQDSSRRSQAGGFARGCVAGVAADGRDADGGRGVAADTLWGLRRV